MTERAKRPLYPRLRRVVHLEPGELPLLSWSAAFFFFVLASNLVLRAVRGQIGVSAGRDNIALLFGATFLTMIVANWLYWNLVNRLPRRRFVPLTYHFIAASLLILYALLRLSPESSHEAIKFTFFVWYSVINLFSVCLFWVCVVDTFTHEQGKRLFAFIGVGGTLGGISGSLLVATAVHDVGSDALLLLSLLFLEIAVFCSSRVMKLGGEVGRSGEGDGGADEIAAGGILAGLQLAVESPYLRSIGLYIFLMSCLGTGIYLQQIEIVGSTYPNEDDRTAYSGWVDFAAQSLTLVIQLFLTARLLRSLGVGGTLLVLPVVTSLGLLLLGFFPVVPVLAGVQVLFASGRYAVAKPAREVLFTVVGKEEKYKSKSFTDTFTPRMGDVGAGVALGSMPAAWLVWTVLPMALIWAWLGSGLGRMHRRVVRGG